MENKPVQQIKSQESVLSRPTEPSFFKKIAESIIYQIIPIMIGVYLGFAINNFGESRKINKQKTVFTKI